MRKICKVMGIAIIIAVLFGILNRDHFQAQQLIKAIYAGDMDRVREISILHPKCVNAYPQTVFDKTVNSIMEERGMKYPLIEACGVGNIEIIQVLVEAGADVNCQTDVTPLSITYTCKADGWYQIAQYLIGCGAIIDYKTDYGGTGYGQVTVLEDILQSRPGRNLSGYIPADEKEIREAFYYAYDHIDHTLVNWNSVARQCIFGEELDILQFLLKKGNVNVNSQEVDGYTILMCAAENGSTESVELLLNQGADKALVDSNGKTAYDYAVERGREENAILLR